MDKNFEERQHTGKMGYEVRALFWLYVNNVI